MAKAHAPIRRKLRKETISRRAAQAETERELVLVAAATLFGRSGYHEASMREIAAHAGFSIGALYKRFESKDALYCEVVQKHFVAIWSAVDLILAQHLDFMSQMRALTGAIFDHYTVNRTFLRVYGIHPPTVAEPFQSRIRQMQSQERGRRALVETLARGQQDGLIAGDVEFLGSMYIGMISRAVNDYLANTRQLPEPEQMVTLFLRGAAPLNAKADAGQSPASRLGPARLAKAEDASMRTLSLKRGDRNLDVDATTRHGATPDPVTSYRTSARRPGRS